MFRRYILPALGLVFFALGAIGLYLPLLPTTPFLLLSFSCFAGSPRLRRRVMKIPFVRDHLENYYSRRGLPHRILIRTLVSIWVGLGLSMLLTRRLWLAIILTVIGLAVSVHVIYMSKPRPEAARPWDPDAADDKESEREDPA